ncbi:hypothetical protein [Brevibacillus sp. HB1.4B]|nr:hypothetical protein [Brevibacillus sp. HB1.4B]
MALLQEISLYQSVLPATMKAADELPGATDNAAGQIRSVLIKAGN